MFVSMPEETIRCLLYEWINYDIINANKVTAYLSPHSGKEIIKKQNFSFNRMENEC